MKMNDWIKLYFQGKKIGLLRDDSKVFFTVRRYLFRKYNSFGITKRQIDFLEERGCIRIIIKSLVRKYYGSYSLSIEYMKEISYLKNDDEGLEPQYLIPVDKLEKM